MFTKMALLD